MAIAAALSRLVVADWRAWNANRNLTALIDVWADAQRHALAVLVIYAQTGSASDFASFEAAIGRSLAVRPVRLALEQPAPDAKEIARRLVAAGIDPMTVAGFVENLGALVALEDFETVLKLWGRGDVGIDGVLEIAYRLRHGVGVAGELSVAEKLLLIRGDNENLQHTVTTLAGFLSESRDRLRWRIAGRGALAAILALAPSAFVVLATRRVRRRGPETAPAPGSELARQSPLGLWQRDLSGATRYANPALLSLFGADGPEGAASRYERIVTADSLTRAARERERHLEGHSSVFEIELAVPGRGRRRVLVSAAPLRSENGEVESVLEHYLDLGDDGALAYGGRQVDGNRVLGQLPVAVWTTDRDLRYTFASGPDLPGVTPESGVTVHDSYNSRTRPIEALRAHERALDGEPVAFEHDLDGRVHRCVVRPLLDPDGRIDGTIGVGVDISDHRHRKVRLEHLASRDPLTNLFNRRYFEEELAKSLADCARRETAGVLLWCDLDNFKDINDSMGHRTGDLFLKRVADAFRIEVRQGETLARLGGDEFGVLLPEASIENATALARRLLESVRRETAAIKARGLRTTASIGLVAFPEHGATAEELLSRADIAMYQAKRAGRGRIEVFSLEDHLRPFLLRMATADQVRSCLEQDRMELHLEPICNLRDLTVARYEALLRMPDQNGKLLSPDSFLEICEGFGLMRDIDRWVIKKSCELLRHFREHGVNIPIEINLSGEAFGDASILTLIGDEIRGGDINPGSLIFEISEKAAFADLGRASSFIEELRCLGCQFAIDDFGVGFSSFGYLRHLSVRYLKIDGSFIRGLHDDPVNQNLVRAMVAMSRSLGVTPVAEFVEDQRTVEWLLAESCLFGQGSHTGLARPVSEVLAERGTAVAARWRAAKRRRQLRGEADLASVG
jgi:diguanylate cyclase (GGDEF)-like protein